MAKTKKKIKEIAEAAIKSLCAKTNYLELQERNGNYPSWDGEILYNPHEESKKSLGRIPYQLKGTTGKLQVENGVFYTYADRVDLENYLNNDTCIMYLVVTVDIATKEAKQIYYADLTAIELTQALKQKGKQPKVLLKPMPDDPDLCLQVFVNFLSAKNLIKGTNIKDLGIADENIIIDSFSFIPSGELQFTGDFSDFIDKTIRLSIKTKAGDRRVHYSPIKGEKAGGDFDVHFNLGNGAAVFLSDPTNETSQEVRVNGELFYDTITTKRTKDTFTLSIGNFMKIYFEYLEPEKKFIGKNLNVEPKNIRCLKDRIHALRFLVATHENGGIEIGGHKFEVDPFEGTAIAHLDVCKMQLEYSKKVEKLFELLQFPVNTNIYIFSEQEQRLIYNLVTTLIDGKPINIREKPEHALTPFTPKLGQYRFALVMIRIEDSATPMVKIESLTINGKSKYDHAFYVEKEESGYYHPVPLYTTLAPEMLTEFSNIDFDDVYKQFVETPIDDAFRAEIFQSFILGGLNAYDNGGPRKEELLQLIIQLLQYEETLDGYETPEHRLNLIQAYKRQRELSDEERTILHEIAESASGICKVAAHLLLDNKDHARYLYNDLKETEKQQFDDFPISHFLS